MIFNIYSAKFLKKIVDKLLCFIENYIYTLILFKLKVKLVVRVHPIPSSEASLPFFSFLLIKNAA